MNITGVLSSSNSCHFEGTSYISGCSFTNGVMDGTATKATKSNAALSQQYQTIGVGAQILRDLGVEKMKLLSSPLRFNALSGFNLEVVEYITAHQTT
jgi:hypothetical protein